MPGIRDHPDVDGRVRLRRWLTRATAERFTGTLRVSGSPGGIFQFIDGMVVAARSPGAPGVQALLVRSGRVSDEDWARDGGGDHADAATRIGTVQRQVLHLMACQDALFAVLAGSVVDCETGRDLTLPDSGQGQETTALLDDALRKIDALATLPRTVHPYQDRLVAASADDGPGAPGTGTTVAGMSGTGLTEVRRAIIEYADGRRTPRDIAFISGRSLFAVTVEMSRMLAVGLLREPRPRDEPADTTPVRVLPRNPPLPSPPLDGTPAAVPGLGLPRRLPTDDGNGTGEDGAACDGDDGPAGDGPRQKPAAFWRDLLHFGGRTGEDN